VFDDIYYIYIKSKIYTIKYILNNFDIILKSDPVKYDLHHMYIKSILFI